MEQLECDWHCYLIVIYSLGQGCIQKSCFHKYAWKINDSESREPQLNRRRLFDGNSEENARASLGMDEDSNMSVNSTASDSQDGVTSAPTAPTPTEGDKEGLLLLNCLNFTCCVYSCCPLIFSLIFITCLTFLRVQLIFLNIWYLKLMH